MALALCRGIRQRYPEWRFLIDGDGGDENLKDYPIEENPELTIRSVLNNRMLYQEGWGVDAIKHSLTYSGGLSRGYARTYAPAAACGFEGFSPYTLPNVMESGGGDPVHRADRLGPRTALRPQGRGRPRAASRPSPASTCRSSPSGASSTGRRGARRSPPFSPPSRPSTAGPTMPPTIPDRRPGPRPLGRRAAAAEERRRSAAAARLLRRAGAHRSPAPSKTSPRCSSSTASARSAA